MNMSGHYTGQYYQPFGPPNQPFGQPNQPYRQPCFPPNYPPDYNPMYPPNYHPPQYFAEYSLWGSSPYNPSELIHPARNGSGMFGDHRPSPPYPPPVQFRPEYHEDPPPMPSVPPDADTHEDGDDAVGGSEEPELTGLEEPVKTVIEKEELYKIPDDDILDIEENSDSVEQSSNSSSSSSGDWTHSNFQRAGAYPSTYPWASRPARVVNNRGKKANIMQRRLVRALSQPVKMDKGASMLQRMGWMGGGLGRDGSGIVDPVAPNAVYASSTVGFGQDAIKTLPSKRNQAKCPKQQISKRMKKEIFKTNVLHHLLDFVKNDLVLELFFDTKLHNNERKRIHMLVAALDGREDTVGLDTLQQQEIVSDIHRRNHYTLTTQSEGERPNRQICVYKAAPNHMFLVTPDDCRPCITEIKEVEEESNPFLVSITKHIKKDEGTILKPKPPHLFDKLVQFFIDFCADEGFTEFRFLGPFTKNEVNVINNFFTLIGDLSKKQKPYFKCPVELLDVFATDFRFQADSDPNGFTSIKKMPFSIKKELEKQDEEKKENEK